MNEPDFRLPSFFVYVIESNHINDIAAGRGLSEGQALSQVLSFSEVPHKHRPVIDQQTLGLAIADLSSVASQFNAVPVLHIAAHGNEHGLALTGGQLVTWRELHRMLMPLHVVRLGSFLFCASSCSGLAAINMALVNAHVPIFGVVGTLQTVAWSDNVIGFATLYHLLNKGRTINEAVSGMRVASGHESFRFTHGPTFMEAVRSFHQQGAAYNSLNQGLG